MNIDGGDPVQLTSGPDSDAEPAFSPDGKFVYYHSTNGEQLATIWRVPVEGGTPEQVTKFRSRKPQVSPDGMSLLCETTLAAGDTVTVSVNRIHVLAHDADAARARIEAACAGAGLRLHGVTPRVLTMEDVFVHRVLALERSA